MDIINSIISLGASVMMPVIFFIIALCFGVKIGTAFKAGMLVGIGFEGVGLVIGLLLTNLGPASQAMVERIGLQLTVVDTGWPTASTIGWGSPLMLPVVVGFIVINLAMLLLKLTKTVNIDIFNYWIFLIMGCGLCRNGKLLAFGRYYIRYFCVDAIGGRFNGSIFTKKL